MSAQPAQPAARASAHSGPSATRRRRLLRTALDRTGSMSVAEAAQLTGVSTATAARDLSAIAADTAGVRVRGGVVLDDVPAGAVDETARRPRSAADALSQAVAQVLPQVAADASRLPELAVRHAGEAARCLERGDLAAADVHARLCQALSVLATLTDRPAPGAVRAGR